MFFHTTHTFAQHLHTFLRNISEITIANDETKILQNPVGGLRKIIQMKTSTEKEL